MNIRLILVIHLLAVAGCSAGVPARTPSSVGPEGLYASHDSGGFIAVSLEVGGSFQLAMTSAADPTFPMLLRGTYVVVRDTVYYRTEVSTKVSAVALRNDSLFWATGRPADALVLERRYR